MDRRRFVELAASLPLTSGAILGGANPRSPASGRTAPAAGAGGGSLAQEVAPSIDGLGEIRLDYPPALLDEILASGLRCCVVTVGNPGLYGADAFPDTLQEIEAYEAHIDAHPDRLMRIRTLADVDEAARTGRLGLVYYPQNATPLERDPERIDLLWERGVRILQLTYNHRNLLGDGSSERTNAGLSEYGLEVVARMNAVGMVVDVSHSGEATTRDAIRHSTAPVAITHAGCKGVFDHPRNKTDAALRAMADGGGVLGIVQLNPYLGPRERNTLEDYLDHIDHAVNLCGIDHVAVGSDREHRPVPDTAEERQKLVDELARLYPDPTAAPPVRWPFFLTELNHPRRMETIRDGLQGRRYSSAEIDKILWGNWYRLFGEVWPA
jgi:membrane dipeptidase